MKKLILVLSFTILGVTSYANNDSKPKDTESSNVSVSSTKSNNESNTQPVSCTVDATINNGTSKVHVTVTAKTCPEAAKTLAKICAVL